MEQELLALQALLALWALQAPPGREERMERLGRLARREVSAQQALADQLGALEPQERLELQDQLGERVPPGLLVRLAQ